MNLTEVKIGISRIVYWFRDMPSLTRFLQNLGIGDFEEIHVTHPENTPRPEETIMLEITPGKGGY